MFETRLGTDLTGFKNLSGITFEGEIFSYKKNLKSYDLRLFAPSPGLEPGTP
jgi:hypothetical protein